MNDLDQLNMLLHHNYGMNPLLNICSNNYLPIAKGADRKEQ